MFEDINQETTRRLTEVHSILRLIKDEGISIDKRILKGLFFVLLYGALEYVIQASVQRCIILLNRKNTPINNLRYSLLGLILNKECNAVSSTSNKQWIKRYELFIKLNEITPINNIDEALFPCPTGNIKYKNIEFIWNIFGIETEVINDVKLKSFLNELAEHRNAIAHGRELSSTIGGRLSNEELEVRYKALNSYCSYIIANFEEYIQQNKHLKKNIYKPENFEN